jgi:hypothetical protein
MSQPADDATLLADVRRLRDLLLALGHPRAAEVERAIGHYERDSAAFVRALNSNRWWAGAGSLAAETMVDNPGLPEDLWLREVRALRELLIAIGSDLMARGGENPGISSWVLAFRNWNDSGV